MTPGSYSWVMDAIQSIGMVVLGWYGWIMKKEMADAKLLREVQEELALAKQKIALIEQSSHNAPTHQDLGDLHNRINDLSGAVRELVGVMSGVQRSLDRVETKLINEGNR
jgi:septal ring factor EnvC (AmiA/AmiB activator)